MDDDFNLPDKGAGTDVAAGADGQSASFVSDLFGGGDIGTKRQSTAAAAAPFGASSNRSTFDDILASAPRRRPQVTFQDEQQQQQHNINEPSPPPQQPTKVASASLLDTLFAGSNTTSSNEQNRRSAISTATKRVGNIDTETGGSGRIQSSQSHRGDHQQQIAASTTSFFPSTTTVASQQSQQSSAHSAAFAQSQPAAELDQLRREISTLRYERAEDQRSIGELRRRLEVAQEEHGRAMERDRQENRQEQQELHRRHERELSEARREADRSAQLLNTIREQQGSFEMLATRLELLNVNIGQVRELVQSVETKGDALGTEWREQQQEHWKRLDAERQRWENAMRGMEQEMDRIKEEYTKEIVDGRRWLEHERELCQTERHAFQEEQSLLLEWIEKAKTQLGAEKAEFLRREHDLLVRVLNERALLEQEQREFRRQRDADVARLREEAEYLDQAVAQVESAKTALFRVREDFERKNAQLNQLRNALMRYEQLAIQLVRAAQTRQQQRERSSGGTQKRMAPY